MAKKRIRKVVKKCVLCDMVFVGYDNRAKYCSLDCSRNDPEKSKRLSDSMRAARSEHPEKFSHGETHSKKVAAGTRGKYKSDATSILDFSSRTTSKILSRLKVPCSRCGWDQAVCDLHHIHGKEEEDSNSHENLCCLCPNCHRLVHTGVVAKEDLIPFKTQVHDDWKNFYYG